MGQKFTDPTRHPMRRIRTCLIAAGLAPPGRRVGADVPHRRHRHQTHVAARHGAVADRAPRAGPDRLDRSAALGIARATSRRSIGSRRPIRAGALPRDASATAPGAVGAWARRTWISSRRVHRRSTSSCLSWSVGTNGRAVEGDVVAIPDFADEAAAQRWLGTIRGKFVLVSRAGGHVSRAAGAPALRAADDVTRLDSIRNANAADAATRRFRSLAPASAPPQQAIASRTARLDSAGVAGILSSIWSGGWGVNKVFARAVGPRAERRRLVRGLRAAASVGEQQPGTARAPHRRGAGDAGRGADVQRRRRAQRHASCRTNTCCSRRTSTAGTAPPARPTTAPARSRCSRRCGF